MITNLRRRLSEYAELMSMGSRTSRMVPDGLSKIPKRARIKRSASKLKKKIGCRSFFDPDLARSAKKVFISVKEGHGRVSEHREYTPKHPDIANSAFGSPSGP